MLGHTPQCNGVSTQLLAECAHLPWRVRVVRIKASWCQTCSSAPKRDDLRSRELAKVARAARGDRGLRQSAPPREREATINSSWLIKLFPFLPFNIPVQRRRYTVNLGAFQNDQQRNPFSSAENRYTSVPQLQPCVRSSPSRVASAATRSVRRCSPSPPRPTHRLHPPSPLSSLPSCAAQLGRSSLTPSGGGKWDGGVGEWGCVVG